MADFLDVRQWHTSANGKNFAVTLGYAKAKAKGDGYYINLNALPIADKEGRVSFEIAPRRERDDADRTAVRSGGTRDLDDGPMPF